MLRSIVVDPGVVDYVTKLLRADGAWQVVTSRDMVPAGEADRWLECQVLGRPDIYFSGFSTLTLVDSAGNTVRSIRGLSDLTGVNGSLRDAVHNLMKERRLDEEVHKPLPPEPREPK